MAKKLLLRLPRGGAQHPHADELKGIASRIFQQHAPRIREIQRASIGSSPSSTALTGTLKLNRLRAARRVSNLRVAPRWHFHAWESKMQK